MPEDDTSSGSPEDLAVQVVSPVLVRPGPFRSLRHRNYRLYFLGQLVSLIGTWAQTTAVMWVAFRLMGNSVGPALVSTAEVAPTLLLGAWGGMLADRFPKRTVLLVTQPLLLLFALALAALVRFADPVPFWSLLVVTAASGVVQAVDFPARLSFIIDMVGRDDLMNAVAMNSMLFNLARMFGPVMAGWLLHFFSPEMCFVVNGLTYLALVVALLRMDVTALPRPVPANGSTRWWDGFRYLMQNAKLGLLILMAGVVTMCGWPCLALLPAFAEYTLGLGADAYSMMLSAVGVGALLAAFVVAAGVSMERARWFILAGLLVVTVGLAGASVSWSLFSAILCCALVGFGLILFLVTTQGVVQLNADDSVRGRVMAVWAMVIKAGSPLGNVIAGPAARHWGEPLVFRGLGTACGAVGVIMLWLFLFRTTPRTVTIAAPKS